MSKTNLKIYFAGAIWGGRYNQEWFKKIIQYLNKYGKVLTTHIGDEKLTNKGEVGLTEEYIYKRDMKWLREADVLVAEVTTPSLGVGYEIAYAEKLNKRVFCLFRNSEEKRLSTIITGDPKLDVCWYDKVEDAYEAIDEFFNEYYG